MAFYIFISSLCIIKQRLKQSALHYYRAVAYYYLADSPNKALAEIYQCLECQKDYVSATRFAKKLSRLPASDGKKRDDGDPASIAYLGDGNYDLFLISLLAQDENGSFILSRIDWNDLLFELQNSPRPTDRIWCLLLRQQWELAIVTHRCEFDKTQGNAVACFQIGYLLCCTKAFIEAEPHLMLLACFGGAYRMASIRLMLHLPQHQFSSLADFPEVLAAGASPEKFQLARILQVSWDQRAFRKFLRIVKKHTGTAQEYLDLARIHLDEGEFALAIKALRKAYQREPQQLVAILRLLATNRLPPERAITRFWQWLVKQLRSEKDLQTTAHSLRKYFPRIALALYGRLEKMGSTVGQWQLGRAICCYHLGELAEAENILQGLGKQCSPEMIYWQAKLCYKQQRYRQALALAEDGLARFPISPLLKKILQQFAEATCPNCDHPQDTLVCPNCGYRPHHIFKAQDDKLRWQGNQFFFPQAIALLTTSAQSYAKDQPVYLLIFSTAAGHTHLCFYRQGEIARRREVSLVAGLVVVKEKDFPAGVYQVEIQSEKHASNRHFFTVNDMLMPLRPEIAELVWTQPHSLDLTLLVKDFLGFPLHQPIIVDACCPGLRWEYRDKLSPDDGKLSLSWQFPRHPGLIVVYLSTSCGKRGSLIIPADHLMSKEEIIAVISEQQKKSPEKFAVRNRRHERARTALAI